LSNTSSSRPVVSCDRNFRPSKERASDHGKN
jgi:hypothetical protein